ncbi:MAG: response regulator transcription factor [Moraxellaceae bacterium]
MVVEDDASIAGTLLDFLSLKGHVADWAETPARALLRLEQEEFEAIVLDRGLPRMEGLRLLRLLRDEMQLSLPVLILTAKDTEEDKLEAFAAGADDYVVKPFSLAEVEARLVALRRRSRPVMQADALRVGNISFDASRHELVVAGEIRQAGPKVMQLLVLLMREPGRVFSHHSLEELLWGEPQSNGDRLRQVLYHARKLIDMPDAGAKITSVHGVGYRLDVVPK